MNCLNCQKAFSPLSVNQKYCSAKCGANFRRNHPSSTLAEFTTFRCGKCGKIVHAGGTDRRTRFCSSDCCEAFWRHPARYERGYSIINL